MDITHFERPWDPSELAGEIRAQFDRVTLGRAKDYRRSGKNADVRAQRTPEGMVYRAEIPGSAPEPYQVEIRLRWIRAGKASLSTHCTCPVGTACKHAAALALRLRDEPPLLALLWLGALGPPATEGSMPKAPEPPKEELSPRVRSWMRKLSEAAEIPAMPPDTTQFRVEPSLILRKSGAKIRFGVRAAQASGGWGPELRLSVREIAGLPTRDASIPPDLLSAIFEAAATQATDYDGDLVLGAKNSSRVLERFLQSGTLASEGHLRSRSPLRLGAPRGGRFSWNLHPSGGQSGTVVTVPPATSLLELDSLWYVDLERLECGPVDLPVPYAVARIWLDSPSIPAAEAGIVGPRLATTLPSLAPSLQNLVVQDVRKPPRIRLTLSTTLFPPRYGMAYHGYRSVDGKRVSLARVEFLYGEHVVRPGQKRDSLDARDGETLVRHHRDRGIERETIDALMDLGFTQASQLNPELMLGDRGDELALESDENWVAFVDEILPKLPRPAWEVVMEPGFEWHLAKPEDWTVDVRPQSAGDGPASDWFEVELGVVVDGQRHNLIPTLAELVAQHPRLLDPGHLAGIDPALAVPLKIGDGRVVLFPGSRLRSMLGFLIELHGLPRNGNGNRTIRMNRLRTLELTADTDWRWLGPAGLRELAERLRGFDGVRKVAKPAGLNTELRPYQQAGLEWLQFLREYGLGGVLADDMGLGKTVQALAHLMTEKESDRADRPSLVVAPTSLMANWSQEAARFAPGLRVLVLHGLDRKVHFERIPDHDLVLTTYPLLPRDLDTLKEHEFHLLILDEAHHIKNAKTTYAQSACLLKARHRICLSGTPIENHLGELWSLFHFLLPGFLGDEQRFNAQFRRPIEKLGDTERRALLARRVAPFLLRRRKEEVARELPPKTEIMQPVELSAAQRDLYETVRLAMQRKVRQEVAAKGLARSQIVVLDALLKLRQICCHPRLLSIPAASKVRESAKMSLLLELLDTLLAEGRRILVFSQFTSLLAILVEELESRKVPHVLLTGQTRDRATPVRRFQDGEVPVFLISLKAGGTGLNLTAADTVIHFDPWWNPAAENQATDRAHRIGQDKKVFVYRLIATGTVEERITALQARKRELVEGLLDGDAATKAQLSAEDLEFLFES